MRTFIETIGNDIELKAQGPDIAALNDARGISGDIEVLCSIDKCTGEVFVDKSLLSIKGISQAIKNLLISICCTGIRDTLKYIEVNGVLMVLAASIFNL